MKTSKKPSAKKSTVEKLYPLLVAYREVESLTWTMNRDILDALKDKVMEILIVSLGKND